MLGRMTNPETIRGEVDTQILSCPMHTRLLPALQTGAHFITSSSHHSSQHRTICTAFTSLRSRPPQRPLLSPSFVISHAALVHASNSPLALSNLIHSCYKTKCVGAPFGVCVEKRQIHPSLAVSASVDINQWLLCRQSGIGR